MGGAIVMIYIAIPTAPSSTAITKTLQRSRLRMGSPEGLRRQERLRKSATSVAVIVERQGVPRSDKKPVHDSALAWANTKYYHRSMHALPTWDNAHARRRAFGVC